jgi:hypothetical protein
MWYIAKNLKKAIIHMLPFGFIKKINVTPCIPPFSCYNRHKCSENDGNFTIFWQVKSKECGEENLYDFIW